MNDVKSHLSDTYFARSGATTAGSSIYFRITGPNLHVEFANQGAMGGAGGGARGGPGGGPGAGSGGAGAKPTGSPTGAAAGRQQKPGCKPGASTTSTPSTATTATAAASDRGEVVEAEYEVEHPEPECCGEGAEPEHEGGRDPRSARRSASFPVPTPAPRR
jgi:hypothetical protein